MAHEVSISELVDGRWVNLPTVIKGKTISADEAVRRFRAGELGSLGGRTFDTQREAVAAAKRRSNPKRRPERNPFRGMGE